MTQTQRSCSRRQCSMLKCCARRYGESINPTGEARGGHGDAESDHDFRTSSLPAGGAGAHGSVT
jgi:hypothetical protein